MTADPGTSLIKAVYDGNESRVRALVSSGANLEERKSDESTPLLLAAETDQFEIAEILIDHGANIWATSEFGDTVGYATEQSRLIGGPDFDARQRVLAKLKERGFPFPAEHPTVIEKKQAARQWPPRLAPAR